METVGGCPGLCRAKLEKLCVERAWAGRSIVRGERKWKGRKGTGESFSGITLAPQTVGALRDLLPRCRCDKASPDLRIPVTLGDILRTDRKLLVLAQHPSQARPVLLGEVIVLDMFPISCRRGVILLPAARPPASTSPCAMRLCH